MNDTHCAAGGRVGPISDSGVSRLSILHRRQHVARDRRNLDFLLTKDGKVMSGRWHMVMYLEGPKKREEVKVCRLVALLRLVLSSSAFVLRLQCCSMYHHFFWTLTYKALNRVLLCINGYTQITRGGIPGCLRSSVLYFPWLFIGSLVYPIVGNKILMKGGRE